ncbi:hypothetical protein HBI39_177450 [Parastagonospora nodorum]|nr:hypothetical protein HBI39_177450 [Parastagonospora nodorum]
MPAIGASLRKWTLCLLLCSVPTPAWTQSTNDTAVEHAGATASLSTTTPRPSSLASTSASTVRSFIHSETTCPFRTINYITHTLPQQCAKTAWSAPGEAASTDVPAIEAGATPSQQIAIPRAEEAVKSDIQDERHSTPTAVPQAQETGAGAFTDAPAGGTASEESESELETESPLDNANFLSFEEWKKRNLEQVGQSPENVQGRAAPSNQATRRRPVNVNALDSLGDEAEIEIDFSGFGPPLDGGDIANSNQAGLRGADNTKAVEDERKATPSSWTLSKDAGKTCKERFNYASFDCAATVLKTNKQAKSATSVLVENKDSYMLNECSANNKFLIVELCDDILVDTVVLANYEFFSSMFRHFRVSVSDRYPVKMERWKTLATFEARNSRDLQPFLITEPQIWARYLRIEFLTQYGNEFYCPLSLLRVHGTTMMEQFRREEEEARGVDDDVDLEAEQEVVKPAVDSGPIPADQVPILPLKDDDAKPSSTVDVHAQTTETSNEAADSRSTDRSHETVQSSTASAVGTPSNVSTVRDTNVDTAGSSSVSTPVDNSPSSSSMVESGASTGESNSSDLASSNGRDTSNTQASSSATDSPASASIATEAKSISKASQTTNDAAPSPSSNTASKAASNNTVGNPHSQSQPRSSSTQPNPATPSTQESFFKSIHKRLLYLEANSTLSLQYIEEQSRILRDAFKKVEKRQLVKTEKFLDHLNSTVMQELKSFRTMYDQLWQSTVIETESMKERHKSEMSEIGTRLTLMADELVWQKRMAVVQSTLLLLCLGLVLFVRSGTLGSAADVPIVQQLGSKYNSFFESSPPHSPPESGLARRRRTFKNMWRSDTSAGLSDHQSDGVNALSDAETDGARSPIDVEYSPPTPTTPAALAKFDVRNGIPEETPSPDDQAKRLEVLETQSGPATPNGTRDSRPSWEEVDRAVDQLKAEKNGQLSPHGERKGKERKGKKRSPLRRAQSSYDGLADGDGTVDTGDEGLFS